MIKALHTSLPLPSKMDAAAAHGLKASLLERGGGSLSLDASEVQQMGALSCRSFSLRRKAGGTKASALL